MSAFSPEKSLDDQSMLFYECPVRVEHQRESPLLFKGQPIADSHAKDLIHSLVLPASWHTDQSQTCLSYAMYVMLASIANYDERLAIEVEETTDTGTNDRECCLSVLVAEAKQPTLSTQYYIAIHDFFRQLLEDTEGLRQARARDGLTNTTLGDMEMEQLCKHLAKLEPEDMGFLLDWTWAHSAPKLKWEQWTSLRGS